MLPILEDSCHVFQRPRKSFSVSSIDFPKISSVFSLFWACASQWPPLHLYPLKTALQVEHRASNVEVCTFLAWTLSCSSLQPSVWRPLYVLDLWGLISLYALSPVYISHLKKPKSHMTLSITFSEYIAHPLYILKTFHGAPRTHSHE